MSLNRNRIDSYGNTLLHLLVLQDNVASLQAVLDSLNEKIRNNPASPLSSLSTFLTSSSASSSHTIESLLNKPNHENGGKRCALHFVRSIRMLKLLLGYSNHINKDAQDMYGLTPLHIYILEGYTDCAKVMIEAGASVNVNCYANQIIEYPISSNEYNAKGMGHGEVVEMECGLHHRSTLLLAAQVANFEILRILLSISKSQSLSSALQASFAWESYDDHSGGDVVKNNNNISNKQIIQRNETDKGNKKFKVMPLDQENTHPNRIPKNEDRKTTPASTKTVLSHYPSSMSSFQDIPQVRSNSTSKLLYDLTNPAMNALDTKTSRKYSDECGNNIWHVLFAATSLSINDNDRQRINFYPQRMLSSLSAHDKKKSNHSQSAGLSELSDLIRLLSEQSSAANKRFSGTYTTGGDNSDDTGANIDNASNSASNDHNESLFDVLLQVPPSKASDLTQQRSIRKLTIKIRKCMQLIAKYSQHRGSMSNNTNREKPLHVLVGNKVLQLREKSRVDLDETQHWNRPVLSLRLGGKSNSSHDNDNKSMVDAHRHADKGDNGDSYSCVLVKAFLYEIASDDHSLHKLVNILDARGATPLFLAIEHRQFSVAELLMKCGADLNYETKFKTSIAGYPGSTNSSRSTSTSTNMSNMGVGSDEFSDLPPMIESGIHVLRASDLIPKYERYRLFAAITSQQTKVPFLKSHDGSNNNVYNGCMECGDMLSSLEDTYNQSVNTSANTSRNNSNNHLAGSTSSHDDVKDNEAVHCSHCQRLLCRHCGGYRVPLPRVFETIPSDSRTMPSFLSPQLCIDFHVDDALEVTQTSSFIVKNTVGSRCYFNLCVVCCDIYRERCIDVHKDNDKHKVNVQSNSSKVGNMPENMLPVYGKGVAISPPKRKLPSPIKAIRKQHPFSLLDGDIKEEEENEEEEEEGEQDKEGEVMVDRIVRRLDFDSHPYTKYAPTMSMSPGSVSPTPTNRVEQSNAGAMWVITSLLVVFVAILVWW